MGLGTDRNSIIISFIVALFGVRRPATVLRVIPGIIINAVKAFALWLRAHVFVEHMKRVPPATTHCDATPAVSGIVRASRITTASEHVFPCLMSGRMSHAMYRRSLYCRFCFQAATGTGESCSSCQAAFSNNNNRFALTQAFPMSCIVMYMSKRLYGETMKLLSGKISIHNILRRCVRKEGCMEGSRKLLFGRSTLSIPECYTTYALYEVMSLA